MGNLARLLQQRFREAAPAGWSSTAEQRIMSADLERQLGFAPRADVLLARTDGSQRIWIEFEISRADPVANHAKFAAAHLFEPRAATDVFVSMVSSHVVYGRSNLAASAVYLMRAVGMSAFQTSLLPTHSPQRIAALNQKPFVELLNGHHFDPEPEIERAIAVTRTMAVDQHHRIHFAANLFEVMVNVNVWNDAIGTPAGRAAWGRRTVTYFVHDPRSGLFAPSKYCAFVPVQAAAATSRPVIAMDMETYASLDESESRFDGNVARRHLSGRLAMQEMRLEASGLGDAFRGWLKGVEPAVRLHPRGPVVVRAIEWG